MTSPTSTNYFTRAMELTHMYLPDVTQQARLEAEQYLMALRDAADGLNLSFHIISNEPVHDLRCFWAFNTIMHHLPRLACSINDAQAEELYRTLFSFIYRYLFSSSTVQRQPMDFLTNKHAQMMVVGLQEFFPSRWTSFFDDAFELLDRRDILPHASDAATVYVLRLFEYIDERVVSVRAQTDRCRELRVRDMELKDAMREHVMPRAVATWYAILCDCRIRAPEIANICLTVAQTYIEWVDFSLFLTAEWINLLYFLVTAPAVRCAACECLFSLVEKKQLPVVKLDALCTLNIVDALSRIISLLQVPPETEEDVNFLEVVSRLTRAVAEQFLYLFEHVSVAAPAAEKKGSGSSGSGSGSGDGGGHVDKVETPPQSDGALSVDCIDNIRAALDTILSQLLRLLSINHSDVSSALLPFVQNYIKSPALRETQAAEILLRLYSHSLIQGLAEAEDQIWLDDVIDQRKQLHNLIRLLFRRYPAIVLQHLRVCIAQAAAPGGGEQGLNGTVGSGNGEDYQDNSQRGEHASRGGECGVNNSGAEGIEAALRYLYELGESVRMEKLQDVENEFSQIVSVVLASEGIAQCPCAVVHLSYFEVMDRYYTFFIYHKEWIPLLLHRLLLLPNGVTNRHPRVRARVCYLFGHLVQLLKTNLPPHRKDIVNAMQNIFASSMLQPSDRRELYEAVGNLLSVNSPTLTGAVDEDAMIVRIIETMLQGLRGVASPASPHRVSAGEAACSEAVADNISFLTALAKGLRASSGGGGDTTSQHSGHSGTTVDTLTVKIFHSTTYDVMNAVSMWHTSAAVRDRAAHYFTQMIHILPFEFIEAYFTAYAANWLTWMEAVPELTKLLRLLLQFVHRSGGQAMALLSRTLPLALNKVASVGELTMSSEEMGIVSESTREKRGAYRQLFALLQGAAQAGCVSLIVSLPPADLIPLLTQLLAAVQLSGETELPKLALQITTAITSAGWEEEGAAHHDTGHDGDERLNNNNSNRSTTNPVRKGETNVCDDSGEAWLSFVLNEVVPAILHRFLLPAFDVRDAKNFLLIGEAGLLLKALMNRLGSVDSSLCVLLYNVLQPLVGEEEATGLVTALQKEPRFSTEMKMRLRNLLQTVKERQAAGGVMT
ncbi:exportin T (tRNA exportin)-like protein [Trypanosoma rangeli]|uniref:Exportin-T n=1 Tax=Trypanosoma rangeli TaxID=5698 RepID=A0A3R7R9G7_TRYRA|nr:exportin T (tRNA exportin)-like protein [Trypanosoma rangeli]RNE98290.1 exportin T (tRNA exportin)-like protein [Trypanosoma rangeli]|eukprot:RNE98290.1 exportin T (tRNA exportin)-like protein [Trypanosoma rangeli]